MLEQRVKKKKSNSSVHIRKQKRAEQSLLLADDSGANNGVKGYNLKHKTAKVHSSEGVQAYSRHMAQRQQKGDQLELGEGKHEKQPTKSQLLSDEPNANKNEQRSNNVLPSKKEKHDITSFG
ncbi:hypothetical protein GH714_027036 [Hevea brasiliensis]|uniref:Uncharacterized protein n=1 Tax=Hevea brasiliensis TaxID=3981 RepID=A0A6A6N4E7_HEVBR|nr:hypothetical protein GH714_027036 [Hevea brasiliensis]